MRFNALEKVRYPLALLNVIFSMLLGRILRFDFENGSMSTSTGAIYPSIWEKVNLSILKINREIIYHMGPTNSGKTYYAVEALSKVNRWVYSIFWYKRRNSKIHL